MNEPIEFTFGVSIDILQPKEDPENEEERPYYKKFRITGRFPSPAYADVQAVVDAAVDFLNGHLDTSFGAVRVYRAEEVIEVAPGEFQLKDGVT